MRLLLQIVFFNTLLNLLFAHSEKANSQAGGSSISSQALRKKVSEESPSNILLLQVIIDLIKEVKELRGLLGIQSEKFEHLESNLLEEIGEIKSKQFEKEELIDIIDNMETRLVENMEDMESKITKVGSTIEVMRSEVRLISQQKLTWQNDTYPMDDPKLISEYAVDGVYTASKDEWNLNPIVHSGTKQKTNMLIIDLGGLFKIHTVKVWQRVRTDCCHDQSIGVLIYADEKIIGAITEFKYIHNFEVKHQVYARKIYLKNTIASYITLREVQVFGSGPYHKDEL